MSHPKRRGEWAELQFMAKAAKLGLQISKPWGELSRYDLVIGAAGHFVSVQVKSTIIRSPEGCYLCGVRPCTDGKPYQPGEFDFLAAYVIAEDVWYIIPARARCPRKNWAEFVSIPPTRPASTRRTKRLGICCAEAAGCCESGTSHDLLCAGRGLRGHYCVCCKSNSPYTIAKPTQNSDRDKLEKRKVFAEASRLGH